MVRLPEEKKKKSTKPFAAVTGAHCLSASKRHLAPMR